MQIRKAKIIDVPKIANMAADFMRYHERLDPYFAASKDVKKKYLEYFRKSIYSGKKLLLVAEDNGKIVGYALGGITSRPPVLKIQKIGMIDDVYLEKKHRGSGIAKIFLECLCAWFKENGIEHIELFVHAKNKIGRKAWKKYGFQEYLMRLKKKI